MRLIPAVPSNPTPCPSPCSRAALWRTFQSLEEPGLTRSWPTAGTAGSILPKRCTRLFLCNLKLLVAVNLLLAGTAGVSGKADSLTLL